MNNWLFLSKNGEDEYINLLAASAGMEPTNSDYFDYHYDIEIDGKVPFLRGILKHKIMHKCLAQGRDFYYVDSGYFGNNVTSRNTRGTKLWHRIVKNDLQQGTIIQRPADRWEKLRIPLPARRLTGNRIIVAAPDEKPCKYYGIDRDQWIKNTVDTIKANTNRPVEVRERAPKREDRTLKDPLSKVLVNDVHALVTFNSIAAVEAVLAGVPAFTLAPTHCAAPVACQDLTKIDTPYWPDSDKLAAWAHSLAYGQFHVNELKNGTALRMIQK